mgnify:FL=1
MMPSVYQLAFSSIKGINVDIANELLSAVGSEENFFRMSDSDLREHTLLSDKLIDKKYRDSLLIDADINLDLLSGKNVRVEYFRNPTYPVRFQTVPDAPLALFLSGDCDLNAKKVVSMVGTRHATMYGMDLCEHFIKGLSEIVGNDVVIVSGLAYGIDIKSHRVAIECGMPTIAVVAHGLDTIYPAQHRSDAVEIVRRNGAILTEYKFNTRVHRSNFLSRNRLIAGLSDCTVVVKKKKKGGALVTANIALNYGRDVFAFPGRVGDEYSRGCNSLISKNVAMLINSHEDFLNAVGWEKKKMKPVEKELFPVVNGDEKKIYDYLSNRDYVTVAELIPVVGLPFHKLLSVLVGMEFNGMVRCLPGNRYTLIKI